MESNINSNMIKFLFLLFVINIYSKSFSQNSNFRLTQKIVASDRDFEEGEYRTGNWFGWDVSIDKNNLVVSAQNKNIGGKRAVGTVYIFENFNNKWVEIQKLNNVTKEKLDCFGWSISLKNNFILIGANGEGYFDSYKSKQTVGAAYFYEKGKQGKWSKELKILPQKKQALFGTSVGISSNYAIISDSYNSTCNIYKKDYNKNTWNISDTIKFNSLFFGEEVTIDDTLVAVSASNYQKNGAVLVCSISPKGGIQEKYLITPNIKQGDFGKKIKLYKNYLMVTNNNSTKKGKVFLFEFKNNKWINVHTFESNLADINDFYGVDMCMNDKYIVIGASGDDIENGKIVEKEGAVYIYKKDEKENWAFYKKIKSSIPTKWDKFGFSVDISDDFLVVGSRFEDEDENEVNYIEDAGAVYIYKIIK